MLHSCFVVVIFVASYIFVDSLFCPTHKRNFAASNQRRVQICSLRSTEDAEDSFPELDMLFSKASIKVQKTRDQTQLPKLNTIADSTISISPESINNNASMPIDIDGDQVVVESKKRKEKEFPKAAIVGDTVAKVGEKTTLSSNTAAESIQNMMKVTAESGGRKSKAIIGVINMEEYNVNLNAIRDIEEAKKRVNYLDKTGQRHSVPISVKPLWYAVTVRNGKERRVLEEFQAIVRDTDHPLNAFVIDSFIHVRPGVTIVEDKAKQSKKTILNSDPRIGLFPSTATENENDISDSTKPSAKPILSGGQYGYAPKKTNRHLKFVTIPTTKGVVYIKASMNPIIHDMILKEVPNLVRFAADEDGTVYPVIDSLIEALIQDRQALYPEEQQLAKKIYVGSYVKLKKRNVKDQFPNLGYGYVLGVEDGLVKVSVKCEKRDLEEKYDIRELEEMDNENEEFRLTDERSRIKQMLESLMEEEPNSRILREFKQRGILDDFLYPERRAIRDKYLNDRNMNKKKLSSSSLAPSSTVGKPSSSNIRMSPNEAQVAAAFGGLDEMFVSMRDMEKTNAAYEKATRKKQTLEQQMGLTASTSFDDFSFLDDLFPTSTKTASNSMKEKPPLSPSPSRTSEKDSVFEIDDKKSSSVQSMQMKAPLRSEDVISIEEFMDMSGSGFSQTKAFDWEDITSKTSINDRMDASDLDTLLEDLMAPSGTKEKSKTEANQDKAPHNSPKSETTPVQKAVIDEELDAWFRELEQSPSKNIQQSTAPSTERPRDSFRRKLLQREKEKMRSQDTAAE